MKINEFVTEGFWSQTIAGLKGMKKGGPGFGAAKVQQIGKEQGAAAVDRFYKAWMQFQGETGSSDIAAWAKNAVKGDVSSIPAPSGADAHDPTKVKQYLTAVYQLWKSGGITSSAYVSPIGIKVTSSSDPIILTYNGKNYMLTDTGSWGINGSDDPKHVAAGTLGAEMDKVARHLLGGK